MGKTIRRKNNTRYTDLKEWIEPNWIDLRRIDQGLITKEEHVAEWTQKHKDYCVRFYTDKWSGLPWSNALKRDETRKRRAAERRVCSDIKSFKNFAKELYCTDYDWYDDCTEIDNTLEFYDEGRWLKKKYSNHWYFD